MRTNLQLSPGDTKAQACAGQKTRVVTVLALTLKSAERVDPAWSNEKSQSYIFLKEKSGSLVAISFTDCTVKARYTDRSGTKSIK